MSFKKKSNNLFLIATLGILFASTQHAFSQVQSVTPIVNQVAAIIFGLSIIVAIIYLLRKLIYDRGSEARKNQDDA